MTSNNPKQEKKMDKDTKARLLMAVEQRVKYWRETLMEAQEQLKHHEDLLRDLKKIYE